MMTPRLTCNAPAVSLIFGSNDIEFFVDETGITVAAQTTPTSFPMTPHNRGGAEIPLTGEAGTKVYEALRRLGDGAIYFRMLHDAGRYVLVPQTECPARHIPFLRLWHRTTNEGVVVPDEGPAWAREVRVAASLVAAYDGQGRIGRPSLEVAKAQETMNAFRALVSELCPPMIDRAALEKVREELNRLLD